MHADHHAYRRHAWRTRVGHLAIVTLLAVAASSLLPGCTADDPTAPDCDCPGLVEHEYLVESWEYLNNRFFRLDLPVLTPALGGGPLHPRLPAVDAPGRRVNPDDPDDPAHEFIDPASIRIFLYVGSGQPGPGEVLDIAVARDSTGRWEADGQTLPPPDSPAWTRGERWSEITGFRLLEDASAQLVAVDLGDEYGNNDLLACTYRVVGDPQDPSGTLLYAVGSPPGSGEERVLFPDDVAYLRMKLLKPDPSIGRDEHTFHYVLRNIYGLGERDIVPTQFELQIEKMAPGDHPERDWVAAGGLTFVRIFGLDIMDEAGNPGSDGLIDLARTEIFDFAAGLLTFPLDFPFPFAADSAQYEEYADTGDFVWEESYVRENLAPEIYDHTTNPLSYNQFGRFRFRIVILREAE